MKKTYELNLKIENYQFDKNKIRDVLITDLKIKEDKENNKILNSLIYDFLKEYDFINENTIKNVILRLIGSNSSFLKKVDVKKYYIYSIYQSFLLFLNSFEKELIENKKEKNNKIELLEEENSKKELTEEIEKINKKLKLITNTEFIQKIKQKIEENENYQNNKKIKNDDFYNLFFENIKNIKIQILNKEKYLSLTNNSKKDFEDLNVSIAQADQKKPAFKKDLNKIRSYFLKDKNRMVYKNLSKLKTIFDVIKNQEFNDRNNILLSDFLNLLTKEIINIKEIENFLTKNDLKENNDFNILDYQNETSIPKNEIIEQYLDKIEKIKNLLEKIIQKNSKNKEIKNLIGVITVVFLRKLMLSNVLNLENENINNIDLKTEKNIEIIKNNEEFLKENINKEMWGLDYFTYKGIATSSGEFTPREMFHKDDQIKYYLSGGNLLMIKNNLSLKINFNLDFNEQEELDQDLKENLNNLFEELIEINNYKYIPFKSKGFAKIINFYSVNKNLDMETGDF